MLDEEEKVLFNFNPKTIHWRALTHLMVYGMQRFIFKMDVSLPSHSHNLIQKVNVHYFEDTSIFFAKTRKIKSKNMDHYLEKVLYSDRVQNVMR